MSGGTRAKYVPLIGFDGRTLGERLRFLRASEGVRLRDVGNSAELDYHSLSKWERDQHQPSLREFAALAEHYGVPMEDLYWGTRWGKP